MKKISILILFCVFSFKIHSIVAYNNYFDPGLVEKNGVFDLNKYLFDNYIMGFANDKFFFIKRELENEASIFIDLDLDPVISKKKILDVDIKNVITATPMVAKKGDIEWNVTLCSNMLTTQVDDGRTNLDISLRIRQEDDMAHDIVLKTVVVGSVPNVENEYKNIDPTNVSNKYFTNVRFAYLIYNVVFETKLYRDVASNETEIYLPSFFGSNLSDQLSIGEIGEKNSFYMLFVNFT